MGYEVDVEVSEDVGDGEEEGGVRRLVIGPCLACRDLCSCLLGKGEEVRPMRLLELGVSAVKREWG